MLAYDRLNLDPISCEPGILTNTLPSHLHTCTNIPISNQEAEHLNISSIVLSQNSLLMVCAAGDNQQTNHDIWSGNFTSFQYNLILLGPINFR